MFWIKSTRTILKAKKIYCINSIFILNYSVNLFILNYSVTLFILNYSVNTVSNSKIFRFYI